MKRRPLIYMSRCFGFEKCRYDGEEVYCEFAEKLKNFVDVIHWCPETAIGLGIPREKIRVVKISGSNRLFQPATGKFFTHKMTKTCSYYLKKLNGIDGFFLKAKSPSCGFGNTKLFRGKTEDIISFDADGFFATEVRKLFPNTPVFCEKNLENIDETKQFLSLIFAGFGGIPQDFNWSELCFSETDR